MTNPFAPPFTRTPPEKWPPWLVYLGLGAGWWVALLIPEVSRSELFGGWSIAHRALNESPVPAGAPADLLYGFVRVVAVISAGCIAFTQLRRSWPHRPWLSAALCYWLGTTTFAATLCWRQGLETAALCMVCGPIGYTVQAFYVVLPMTWLTARTLLNVIPVVERRVE